MTTYKPRSPGRPQKISPEIIKAICERIIAGTPPEIAARCEGIATRTYYLYKRFAHEHEAEGQTPEDSIYVHFLHAIERAHAEQAGELVAIVKENARGYKIETNRIQSDSKGRDIETLEETIRRDPRSAEFLLERNHPNSFGRNQTTIAPTYEQALDMVVERLEKGHTPTIERILSLLPDIPSQDDEDSEDPESSVLN